MLAASLAGDVAMARRAVRTHRSRTFEIALNALDAAAWACVSDEDPLNTRTAVIATVVSCAMETGFRLGAGTEAVPVIDPTRPWRPAWHPRIRQRLRRRSRRDDRAWMPAAVTDGEAAARPEPFGVDVSRLIQVAVEFLIDVLPPYMALVVGRRRRGLRTGFGAFGWAGLATAGGYGLARGRADAQHVTRELWDERTSYLLAEARVQSRVQSVLMHNVARVDPKGILAYLERAGSSRAGAVLDESGGAPERVTAAAEAQGLTLAAAVDLRTIEPPEHRIRWMSEAQVRHIRDEMERIDTSLESEDATDRPDDRVTVVRADGRNLVLDYRGSQIDVVRPTPQLVIRLEPTIPGLAASSLWTLSTALELFGAAPRWAAVTATALQWCATWRLASQPALERRGDRFTAVLVTASTLLLNTAIARSSRRRHGDAADPGTDGVAGRGTIACAATGATQALSLLVGGSWDDLRAERYWLVGLAGAAWLVGARPLRRLSWQQSVTELAFLAMPALASATIGSKTRREAHVLDDALHSRLTESVERTARAEARSQIRLFTEQLRCVVDELPGLHPGLADAEVDDIVAAHRSELDRIQALDPLDAIGLGSPVPGV